MITDFEEQTQPLDLNEKKCMEIIARGLAKKLGKDNAVTNKEMCTKMNQAISDGVYKDLSRDYKLTGVRIRKIINQIRTDDIVPLLCATSTGYFVANNREEAESYIRSLKDRISSIQEVATSFVKQYNEKFQVNQIDLNL